MHSDAQMSSALLETESVSAESDDVPPPPESNAPCTSDSDVASHAHCMLGDQLHASGSSLDNSS